MNDPRIPVERKPLSVEPEEKYALPHSYWKNTRLHAAEEDRYRQHHAWWEKYLEWHPEAR